MSGSAEESLDSRVAQPGDSMFSRNVAHFAKTWREVVIQQEPDDPELVYGFIAGLDEEYIQIATTEDQRLVLLKLPLYRMDETGRNLRQVREEEGNAVADRLRERCAHYADWASKALRGKKKATWSGKVNSVGDDEGEEAEQAP